MKDCFSKKINSAGYCAGRSLGESCDISRAQYCDVGLYCAVDKTCKPVKKKGEACTALNECATYLICNLGVPGGSCTLPYSLAPMTMGQFTAIPQLCSTGWVNSTIYMCKPPAEFSPGTLEVAPIVFEKEKLCKYADGTVLDASCIYYSKTPMAVYFCQPYSVSNMKLLADIKAYTEMEPQCAEGLMNIFCDRALESISPCLTNKALKGMLYSILKGEEYYPDCWEKTYTLTAGLFKCNATHITVSLSLFFLLLLLILLL